jgi:hypothetical protein
MIGIVSHQEDLHAVTVRQHLDHISAEHVVIDTALLPAELALTTYQSGTDGWTGQWGAMDLSELSVMWWRRPQPFTLHQELKTASDRMFSLGECSAAVSGMWSCLDAIWVNDPDRDEIASRKMYQLKVASEIGLRVPRTCITNSPEQANLFITDNPGGVIYKPFGGTPETWRETRLVREHDMELLDCVRTAPVIFQEAIGGGCDIRVTVIGDQLFPAQILSRESAYEFDFRIDSNHAPTSVHVLPERVVEQLLRLMSQLGLHFGAIDLRLSPEGEYVFLEINPAGQWLFIEYATGQPISEALANHLATLARSRNPVPAGVRSNGRGLL